MHTSGAEQSKEFENSGSEFEFSHEQYKLLGMLTYFCFLFWGILLWFLFVCLFGFFNQPLQNTFHGLFTKIKNKKQ